MRRALSAVAVVGNPGHHTELMLPVVTRLLRGLEGAPAGDVHVISIAELRGQESPRARFEQAGARFSPLLPLAVRKRASVGQTQNRDRGGSLKRRLARSAVWLLLERRLAWLVRRRVDVALVPNDFAYPYDRICALFVRRRVPVVLLQEGIRFPLPVYGEREAYGTGGHVVAAYGELAVEHFAELGVPRTKLFATGSPRFDSVVTPQRAAGRRNAIAYLSNPIDDIGFCSPAQKVALFERFLDEVRPLLARGVRVLVRLHPRESRAELLRAIDGRGLAGQVELPPGALGELLERSDCAVVLASTVGLEALMHGVPVGVLEIPGHGWVHDYVREGAAVGLSWGRLADQLEDLSGRTVDAAGRRYIERSLANRGQASDAVTRLVLDVAARGGSRG